MPRREVLRAAVGVTAGLGLAAVLTWATVPDGGHGAFLIAPFGATAVLMFAVPNSPLAQPWSAVVGNSSSAVVALATCLVVSEPLIRIPLAVGLAVLIMALLRAAHPPGGAIAMTVALSPDVFETIGFGFVLVPVAAVTVLLALTATGYARLTGRHYPFRQYDTPNGHGTGDHDPVERLGLTESELSGILVNYRQSLNLGVEDLARLIAAAEIQAAGRRTGPLDVANIMSKDLVTVGPATALREVAGLFTRHRFTALPVVDGDRFLGIIFQRHLIGRLYDDTVGAPTGLAAAARLLLHRTSPDPACAADLMDGSPATATPTTPVAALLPNLADTEADAVPVLHGDRIVGIVTRTDLIAALARSSLTTQDPPEISRM